MRIFKTSLGITLVALVFALNSSAQDTKKLVKPQQRWAGVVQDTELRGKAPKHGLVTEKKRFEEIWSACRPKDKTPEIDFAKQFVVIHSVDGPNTPTASYRLIDGDLQARTLSTLIGGKAFGYSIEVMNREGIKSYQGKKIEEPK